MPKLLWWLLVFTLVVMVDQTEGLWRRRRRRRRSCSARSCDVSSWSWWSSCSQSCGWGRQSRSREVIRSASCGGSCSYALYDSQSCLKRYCPVNGGWSSWSSWTSCNKSCGTGVQKRSRSCTNPPRRYGGRYCYGSSWNEQPCNKQPCPVDGGWSTWFVSTPCNVTCANGTEILSRNCTKPEPKYGGTPCQGVAQKKQACALKPCPIDGAWSSWSEWIHCSKSCGPGIQQHLRNCTRPAPRYGGKTCPGAARKNRWCYLRPCPVHGSWSAWSLWSPCDKICGKGVKVRTRSCTNPPPFYGEGCGTHHYESKECASNTCPVHGSWNAWSSWSLCSKTCGGAVRERTRSCTNPPPFHGGNGCGSHYYESKECAVNKCPVHGGWSNWSNWTECSVTCGAGVRLRERHCDNPVPAYGGRTCEGNHKDKKPCSTGEVCIAGVGCYKSFPSVRLGNFTDEIQWLGHFSSQMQKIVKKCAHLAVKKQKRFFAVEDFGNCYGAQNSPSGSESKAARCIFGVGVKHHYYVYVASL